MGSAWRNHARVIQMDSRYRIRVAGLVAVIAASVTGCVRTAGTAAPGTVSPAPGATAAAGSSAPPPASTVSPGTASPSTAGAPRCQPGQLETTMIYGGAAAGTVGAVIGFTNVGSAPCHLAGWPGLMAISPAGRARPRRTLSVFAGPMLTRPPVVMIRPGRRAVAVLAGGDQPGPGMTKCPPAYRRLRVAPPGSAHATVISAYIPYLGANLPACSTLQASPVLPPSDLPFLRLHHV